MARKIKFPLIMKNGFEVRTIEELKGNFDLESIIDYFLNGKLKNWLEQRNYMDELEIVLKLQNLDNHKEISKKICEIFNVEVNEDININNFKELKEREKKLLEYIDDEKWKSKLDYIAFNQQELDSNLLSWNFDKSFMEKITYLCGDEFTITQEQTSITYIGVNKCTVILEDKKEFDCKLNKIKFENVKIKRNGEININFYNNKNCEVDSNVEKNLNKQGDVVDKNKIIKDLEKIVENNFIITNKLTENQLLRLSKKDADQYIAPKFSDSALPYYSTSWYKYSNDNVDFTYNKPTEYSEDLNRYYNDTFQDMLRHYKNLTLVELMEKYTKLEGEMKYSIDKINNEINQYCNKNRLKKIKDIDLNYSYTEYDALVQLNNDISYLEDGKFSVVLHVESRLKTEKTFFGGVNSAWEFRLDNEQISKYKKSATGEAEGIENLYEKIILRKINETIPNEIKNNVILQLREIVE